MLLIERQTQRLRRSAQRGHFPQRFSSPQYPMRSETPSTWKPCDCGNPPLFVPFFSSDVWIFSNHVSTFPRFHVSIASVSMFFHETVRFSAGERSSRWTKTTWRASKSRGSTSTRTPVVRGRAPRSFVNMTFRGNSQGLDGSHARRQH